ncbi:CaiB/BaiF CoA transferase family protein [Sulfobacillus harzensis]|uniref:CoA transferase n=1 Tax=Sulfobacillus harzensis TaxID=2729629 RepID=A0A7Y0L4D9_9FIRM|nr:CoA transferase [Sulfobacillus harzensis]NMP23097.1 CoA transferase [Sulfobacillus harzensis]
MGEMALYGIRVLELGQLVAAPSVGRMLADLGADVIKVEPLTGDPLRHWGHGPQGASWWWQMQARNKRLVALDLHSEDGQRVARDLAASCDVLVENFRPGRLSSWNLGYDQVRNENPGIIYASISGYGQTGPYRERAGFGNIAEAMGGLRYVTGFPDRPPVRTGVSIGDELAALHAVVGILAALYQRSVDPDRRGDFVDVALTESVLSIMEGLIPEYVNGGIVQERTGNNLLRAAPSNIYPTRDQQWIAIGANSPGTFPKLTTAMNRPDIAADPRFQSNEGRVRYVDELDSAISEWTARHGLRELVELLAEAGVPAGPVMSAKDIVEDPQIQARGMIQYAPRSDGTTVGMFDVVPKLRRAAGRIRWAGGNIGAHTDEVLRGVLRYSPDKINQLHADDVVR